MMKKKDYKKPEVLRIVRLSMNGKVLAGSVVNDAEVKSMGQEVIEYDFSDDSFNHDWE